MKEKVLAIIARKSEEGIQFLALRNNPADPAHGGDFYYVVTGNVEDGEIHEKAILREVDEETGISRILHLIKLPIEREYSDTRGNQCHELMYGLVTDQDVEHLSEEHIEWKWLTDDDFRKTIRWYGGADELKELLSQIERLI